MTKSLAHLDLLTESDVEFEVLGSFVHQDDRAAEPEATNFVACAQRLPTKELGRFCVCSFRERPGCDRAERRVRS